MINIKGLDKAEVLAALYNDSVTPKKIKGKEELRANSEVMSKNHAKCLIETNWPQLDFNYVRGRILKVNISGDEFDESLYDRDLGNNAARNALRKIL